MKRVITIGREFGSGGRELGRRLAEELSIEYYDREVISEIAEHTALSEDYVRQVVENQPHMLFPITIGHSFDVTEPVSNQQVQQVYQAQQQIIRDLAEKSECVIIGRCADFILRDSHPFRLFVYADIDARIQRCMARDTADPSLTENEIRKHIHRMDKKRARYYEFYTGQRWGARENYEMMVNTTGGVIEQMAPVLAKFFRM